MFAIHDGLAVICPVKIGLSNDEEVEVRQGLAAGDQVILAPETNLAEGQRVRAREVTE